MKTALKYTLILPLIFLVSMAYGQRGKIIRTASTSVMDPNQDGFVSKTTDGFSNDGYYVDEFELNMFGIPKLGGDVVGDNVGMPCGVTDLIPDQFGYSVYAVRDDNNNLIFRFRVGRDQPSVEAYTILLDTDGLFGANDPNATPNNPGFEIDITLIKRNNAGVLVYNIDGVENCPAPLKTYPLSSHFQISVADEVSCNNPDYFYDFYVPFDELAALFNIDVNTGLRYVAVTNVSATCAMAGKIADLAGVDYSDYSDCVPCGFEDLIAAQCPTPVIDLCETCTGFDIGLVDKPTINGPVRAGQTVISGTSETGIYINLQVFSRIGGTDENPVWSATPRETHVTFVPGTDWLVNLDGPLLAYDRIVARAQKTPDGVGCGTADESSSTSVTVVEPNEAPVAFDQLVDVPEDTPTGITLVGTDPDGDPLTYSIVSQPSHGTLTGTGPEVIYTPDQDYFGPDSFTFQVYDGAILSNIATLTINVIPVNDPPVITGTTTPVTYPFLPVIVDAAIIITDVDDTHMESALVWISTNFQAGQDVLQFVNQNGISGVYDAATGVLTLSGTATIEHYMAALSSITYENTSATPVLATRQVSYMVNDGDDDSNIHIRSIVFDFVNDPPEIGVDTLFYTINEDEILDACVPAVDPDGDPVVIESILSITNNGNTINTGGLCFQFTPDQDYFGEERIRIVVTDQRNPAGRDTVIVVITILPVNDPPVITGSLPPVQYPDAPVVVDPAIVITDVDDTEMESALIWISSNFQAGQDVLHFTNQNGITGVFNPATGVLTLTGTASIEHYMTALSSIEYENTSATPVLLTRQVSFVVNDGEDNSNTHIRSIQFDITNNPPVIGVDTLYYTINEDEVLNQCVPATDPDGDQVVIESILSFTNNGVTVTSGGLCFQFTPTQDYFGEERIRIVVTDQRNPAGRDTVIVVITVLPVNDPPVITGSPGPITYPGQAMIIDPAILITDVDDTEMESATIRISANFQAGQDVLLFTDQNGISGVYNPATGVLTLTGTSSIANYIAALASIRYENTSANPVLTTRQVSFTVNDGDDDSNVHTRSILFELINNPPVVVPDTLYFTINEDEILNECIAATDADGDIVVIESIVSFTNNGVSISTGGLCFRFTPAQDYFGEERLRIVVTDQRNPAGRDTVYVVITILPVNDPPVVQDMTVTVIENETKEICLTVTDVEGDPAQFISGISLTGNGSIADGTPGDLCFDYTPNPGFTGQDQVVVTVCEVNEPTVCGIGTVTVNVIPANRPPVLLQADTLYFTVPEDSVLYFCFGAFDPDGDDLRFVSAENVSGGGTIEADIIEFCFFFTPVLNYNGLSNWKIVICDDGNPELCATTVVIIDVTPVNDPPVAVNDYITVTANEESVPYNILDNDYDVDGDELILTTTPIAGPFHGTVVMQTDGTIRYTPNTDFVGSDSLKYEVCDTGVPTLCDTAVVFIEVEPPPPIVLEFKIYEGVSPNGDEKNDYWRIDGIERFPNNHVRVFDRYSNLVFETRSYSNESNNWTGQSNHGVVRADLPEGTYYYSVDLGDGTSVYKGYVFLKRK